MYHFATWTAEVQQRADELETARIRAETEKSLPVHIAFSEATAKYRREKESSARNSWIQKTESLDLDRDGHKLWNLAKALSDEKCNRSPVIVEQGSEMCSGKKAANVLVEKFASVSRVAIPRARQAEVKQQLSSLQSKPRADEEHLATEFAMAELQEGLDGLKLRKSPGKDGVTNEMLKNLGRGAKETLLKVINVSWKTGKTPAACKEAIMVPILKAGKNKLEPASYRPISLLSCMGKLMERMVNRRL